MKRSKVERILESLAREFMTPDIQGPKDWFEVESPQGEFSFVQSEYIGDVMDLASLKNGKSIMITAHRGKYGARLSAAAYLDCTDWIIFDTVEAAEEYLAEIYGDDIGDDDE